MPKSRKAKNRKAKVRHINKQPTNNRIKDKVVEGEINYKLTITETLKNGLININLHVDQKENLTDKPEAYSYILGKVKNILDDTEKELRSKSNIITYNHQEQRENLAKILVAKDVIGDFLGQATENTIKKMVADEKKS